jgi:hypothetical protein
MEYDANCDLVQPREVTLMFPKNPPRMEGALPYQPWASDLVRQCASQLSSSGNVEYH